MPKELGGTGKGENPEQLFAMGYACQCSMSHRFSFVLCPLTKFSSHSMPPGCHPARSWPDGQSRQRKERDRPH